MRTTKDAEPLPAKVTRDHDTTATVLRQGAMIVARSPWLFVGLVALEALFVLAQVTVLAFAFVLPSVMVLMAAHVAVPCADSVHRDTSPARSEAHRGLAASIARTYDRAGDTPVQDPSGGQVTR